MRAVTAPPQQLKFESNCFSPPSILLEITLGSIPRRSTKRFKLDSEVKPRDSRRSLPNTLAWRIRPVRSETRMGCSSKSRRLASTLAGTASCVGNSITGPRLNWLSSDTYPLLESGLFHLIHIGLYAGNQTDTVKSDLPCQW